MKKTWNFKKIRKKLSNYNWIERQADSAQQLLAAYEKSLRHAKNNSFSLESVKAYNIRAYTSLVKDTKRKIKQLDFFMELLLK